MFPWFVFSACQSRNPLTVSALNCVVGVTFLICTFALNSMPYCVCILYITFVLTPNGTARLSPTIEWVVSSVAANHPNQKSKGFEQSFDRRRWHTFCTIKFVQFLHTEADISCNFRFADKRAFCVCVCVYGFPWRNFVAYLLPICVKERYTQPSSTIYFWFGFVTEFEKLPNNLFAI